MSSLSVWLLVAIIIDLMRVLLMSMFRIIEVIIVIVWLVAIGGCACLLFGDF